MIRAINQKPNFLHVPTDDGRGMAPVRLARGLAIGRYFVGLLYTHDDWMFTVTAIEAIQEPRDE